MYFIDINITQHHVLQSELEKEKPLLCCFTWTVFIELNFTVAFLLIRKIWDNWFSGKVGGWGILRNQGDPKNGVGWGGGGGDMT